MFKNQAEHLEIAKALDVIETIEIAENSPRTITVFTDSRIAIDSLKNVNKQLSSRRNQEEDTYLRENKMDSTI